MPILRITSGWALTHTPLAESREAALEFSAVATLVNRIDPDEYAIERGELCAHGVKDVIFVDHRLRIHADMGERREDGLEPAGLWRGPVALHFIAPP